MPQDEMLELRFSLPANGFYYDDYDQTTRETLKASAERIRSYGRQTAVIAAHIGEELIKAKKLLPHGMFKHWILAEFGFSIGTAENLMNAAELLQADPSFASLPKSVLYLVAAESTSAAARERIKERLEADPSTPPTVEETRQLIAGQDELIKSNQALAHEVTRVQSVLDQKVRLEQQQRQTAHTRQTQERDASEAMTERLAKLLIHPEFDSLSLPKLLDAFDTLDRDNQQVVRERCTVLAAILSKVATH